jgi:transcriptional regulator with XRE-family HTH domain
MPNQIKDLRKTRGWSQDELAHRSGTTNQMISMLERDKRGLTVHWMERLANALGCLPADLLAKPDGPTPFGDLPENLPVLGTAAGASSGAFQLDHDNPIGFVRRPPGISGTSNVYAIYVVGGSMSPEHRNGELRFVDPDRKPRIGDSVIVQTQNFPGDSVQTYIKHLKDETPDWLLLGQLNPIGEIRVAPGVVRAIHRILNMNELFDA